MAFKNHVLKSKKELVTCDYGNRTYQMNGYWVSDWHNGIDLVQSPASLDWVIAFQSGKVIAVLDCVSGFNTAAAYSAGNYVIIQHKGGYVTKYFHMQLHSIKVKVGQIVNKGQVLGYMGNTGWSSGAHLHFGVYKDGNMQDPAPYLKGTKSIPAWIAKKITTKTTKEIKMRKGAYSTASTLLIVPKGKTVQWHSDDKWGWSKITYGGKTGYVPNTALAKPGLSKYKVATCTGTNVRIREKANTSAKIIATIGKNKKITVYSIIPSGWIYGKCGTKTGFIYYDARYIKI